ncbi:thermonuclease family protein [Guyparkeria sp.]|uniref:thermonuclease family protein n=1 Tax=Guyparkeria sp. TaxID=2035736 RepID=UPI00356561FC
MQFCRETAKGIGLAFGALFRWRPHGLRRPALAALLVLAGLSSGCVAGEELTGPCAPPTDLVTESATVGYVNDGDTVRLTNGDRVRLVGIDTPELGRDGAEDEPFAREAQQALRALLAESQNRVVVVDAAESEDRYGRRLSYLYLPDGRSVQADLLKQGVAMAVFVAPNLELADCLTAREREARRTGRGIWSLPAYDPGLPTREGIPDHVQGAAIVQGRVVSVGQSRNNIWINLEGRVALKIDRDRLESFPGWDFESLEGERLRARGWVVHYSNRYQDWMIPVGTTHALERLD